MAVQITFDLLHAFVPEHSHTRRCWTIYVAYFVKPPHPPTILIVPYLTTISISTDISPVLRRPGEATILPPPKTAQAPSRDISTLPSAPAGI